MHGVENVKELKILIHRFIKYHNTKRLHSIYDYKTPMSVYKLSMAQNRKELFQFIYENVHEKSVA